MFFDNAVAHLGLMGLAALLLVGAATSDAVRYRIPNLASIGLMALFPFFVLTAPSKMAWVSNFTVFLFVFGIGYLMYLKKLAGAGDIKLLAATSLWAGPMAIGAFLFITAIAGGLLGLLLATLTWLRNRKAPLDEKVPLRKVPIPYGVAIAIGGLAALMQLAAPYLFPA